MTIFDLWMKKLRPVICLRDFLRESNNVKGLTSKQISKNYFRSLLKARFLNICLK